MANFFFFSFWTHESFFVRFNIAKLVICCPFTRLDKKEWTVYLENIIEIKVQTT